MKDIQVVDLDVAGANTRCVEGVTLYDEFSFEGTGHHPPSTHFSQFGMVLAATSAAAQQALVNKELRDTGFEGFEYSEALAGASGHQPVSLLASHIPEGWAQAYCDERLWQADPRVGGVGSVGVPSLWTVADLLGQEVRKVRPSSQVLRFLGRLRDFRFFSGMTLLIAARQTGRVYMLHWLSCRIDPSGLKKELLARALMMGLGVHEVLSRQQPAASPEEGRASRLSTQQRRIAQCLADGMSDKAIARLMCLSPHTVDYHLRALRRRFNVQNRVQLLSALTDWGAFA